VKELVVEEEKEEEEKRTILWKGNFPVLIFGIHPGLSLFTNLF